MAPEARSKFGAPMFEPEVFWKQMYCIEASRVHVNMLGLFGAPRSDLAPPEWLGAWGITPPCPRVTPLYISALQPFSHCGTPDILSHLSWNPINKNRKNTNYL